VDAVWETTESLLHVQYGTKMLQTTEKSHRSIWTEWQNLQGVGGCLAGAPWPPAIWNCAAVLVELKKTYSAQETTRATPFSLMFSHWQLGLSL